MPAERRGEGLGLIGVVAMLPAVVALPLGVWLVSAAGFPAAFTAGALASVLTVVAVVGLPDPAGARRGAARCPGRTSQPVDRPARDRLHGHRGRRRGVVVTFLPASLTPAGSDLAALALLVQAAAATVTRWLAGRYADRHPAPNLLLLGVLAVAAGMLCLVLSRPAPPSVLAGMILFGVGFGVAQSASLTQMFDRVPASGYGTVSAVWNMGYDVGWGAGAAGIGLVVRTAAIRRIRRHRRPHAGQCSACQAESICAADTSRRRGRAQRIEEGVGPAGHVVVGDPFADRTHPAARLPGFGMRGPHDRVLDSFDVVGVDQERTRPFRLRRR